MKSLEITQYYVLTLSLSIKYHSAYVTEGMWLDQMQMEEIPDPCCFWL